MVPDAMVRTVVGLPGDLRSRSRLSYPCKRIGLRWFIMTSWERNFRSAR
jgi:hypothetical protein